MDKQQHSISLFASDSGVSLQQLSEKLVALVEMEFDQTREARAALKHAKNHLAELQAPFEVERKVLCAALCRQMLAIGSQRIRHELFTFSAFTQTTWDADKLAAMLPEIPALRQCVSQEPRSRLVLKD